MVIFVFSIYTPVAYAEPGGDESINVVGGKTYTLKFAIKNEGARFWWRFRQDRATCTVKLSHLHGVRATGYSRRKRLRIF